MAHAAAHLRFISALGFFLDWPAPDRAARLLIDRHDEINGDHNEFLAPAAETLPARHPLAATLALRAMIDFTLTRARSKRYRYAAEHLGTCARLACDIEDFGAFETHDGYIARLKQEHGGSSAFGRLSITDDVAVVAGRIHGAEVHGADGEDARWRGPCRPSPFSA